MVRALLDGRKTQTRRTVKPQPVQVAPAAGHAPGLIRFRDIDPCLSTFGNACPYGQPGDQLWVREAFSFMACGVDDLHICYKEGAAYRLFGGADGGVPNEALGVYHRMFNKSAKRGRKALGMPSIFMPRWASRITLEITSVRVERLNDISEADAMAEGVSMPDSVVLDDSVHGSRAWVEAYRLLWESINGAGSWALNPWVWVIVFKNITQ
jgi:hypothetical protein